MTDHNDPAEVAADTLCEHIDEWCDRETITDIIRTAYASQTKQLAEAKSKMRIYRTEAEDMGIFNSQLKEQLEQAKAEIERLKFAQKIIEAIQSGSNESTSSPYWLIIDPHQMFSLDVRDVASMITGPFFSRKDAQNHLEGRNYNYSDNAKVYCHSGYWSHKYHEFAMAALDATERSQ